MVVHLDFSPQVAYSSNKYRTSLPWFWDEVDRDCIAVRNGKVKERRDKTNRSHCAMNVGRNEMIVQ